MMPLTHTLTNHSSIAQASESNLLAPVVRILLMRDCNIHFCLHKPLVNYFIKGFRFI